MLKPLHMSSMYEQIRLPYVVPYYAQIASLDLAEAIFVHGLDPVLDPRWAESGAATPQEYAYWVERACGVACLKMGVEALGGPNYPLVQWARMGVAQGGYLVRYDEQGDAHEVGWIHAALAQLARGVGLAAEARAAGLAEILDLLRQGALVIASVSYEVGDDQRPVTRQGGHLMVVVGAESAGDGPVAFLVNNPSGHGPAWQAAARVPAERFALGYSGRVVVLRRDGASLL